MRCAGLDIGSRTVKLVVLEDDRPVFGQVVLNSHDPLEVCRELLDRTRFDRLVVTGYGRHLFASRENVPVITEIRAVALGSRRLFPGCGAIIDVGGQDTKAIRLDDRGEVGKFEMNDKCAAGTGRFLEVMAAALGWSPAEFEEHASRAAEPSPVSAMCTVFAESEVVSSLARGVDRAQLALGIHQAIVERTAALARRVGCAEPLLFCGGVAHNRLLADLLDRQLGFPIFVPENPQTVAALGAACEAVFRTSP